MIFFNHFIQVIVLIDNDCFYCQVEQKLNKSLKGVPLAVVQYNKFRGGGIIAGKEYNNQLSQQHHFDITFYFLYS